MTTVNKTFRAPRITGAALPQWKSPSSLQVNAAG